MGRRFYALTASALPDDPTQGRSCSRRLKSGFCARTDCVPTSPILGPASRCRHFVSRCPTALPLCNAELCIYIVFHHMVISSHIVTTLMKRSTHKRQARITITHKILKWECVGTWKSNSDYVVTSKDCCNNTMAYLKKWSIMVLEQCGVGRG